MHSSSLKLQVEPKAPLKTLIIGNVKKVGVFSHWTSNGDDLLTTISAIRVANVSILNILVLLKLFVLFPDLVGAGVDCLFAAVGQHCAAITHIAGFLESRWAILVRLISGFARLSFMANGP